MLNLILYLFTVYKQHLQNNTKYTVLTLVVNIELSLEGKVHSGGLMRRREAIDQGKNTDLLRFLLTKAQ